MSLNAYENSYHTRIYEPQSFDLKMEEMARAFYKQSFAMLIGVAE